jgi:hypothetical protein
VESYQSESPRRHFADDDDDDLLATAAITATLPEWNFELLFQVQWYVVFIAAV